MMSAKAGRSASGGREPPVAAPAKGTFPARRWLGGAAFLLLAGAGIVVLGPQPGWWDSLEEGRLIHRFAGLVNLRDDRALDLLGPGPVFDDEPVSEKVAEARQADFYLHCAELKILTIRRGEPGPGDTWLQTPGRYTLVTDVKGSTPPLRVRNDKGEVESPSRLFMINPDLVVEVVDGKVRGVRPELHRD
jgi:hypothetical protein